MGLNDFTRAFLLDAYLEEHRDLTPAAHELLCQDIAERPEKYATTPRARALVAYERTQNKLTSSLEELGYLQDDEFVKSRAALFAEIRTVVLDIAKLDNHFVEPRLMAILLDHAQPDSIISDLMKLEEEIRGRLRDDVDGFDVAAPHFWTKAARGRAGVQGAAGLTRANLTVVGWLRTLEALSQHCMQTARYRRAADFARTVMRAKGYPNRAEGTVLLTLARLEDEQGFFELAHQLGAQSDQRRAERPEQTKLGAAAGGGSADDSRSGSDGSGAEANVGETATDVTTQGCAADHPENSPWYLLARTILLYKIGRGKAARRALRDFCERCEGGAFFLLNPTYLDPYLPVRPEPRESWDLSHQAVWEADAIISDTPDFVPWAESIEGTLEISDAFASRAGF